MGPDPLLLLIMLIFFHPLFYLVDGLLESSFAELFIHLFKKLIISCLSAIEMFNYPQLL